MFSTTMSNDAAAKTRRPPSQMGNSASGGAPGAPFSRTILADIDAGRVTLRDIEEKRRQQRLKTPTTNSGEPRAPAGPSPILLTSSSHLAGHSRSLHNNNTSKDGSTLLAAAATPIPFVVTQDISRISDSSNPMLDDRVTFSALCDLTTDSINPEWLKAKVEAEAKNAEREQRLRHTEGVLHALKHDVGTQEALEVARLVARQEEAIRKSEQRNTLQQQVSRFAELELKAHGGNVSREDRRVLLHPETVLVDEDSCLERAVQRHRHRETADRPFRHMEPQHMTRMANSIILKESELESFGDELTLLASKSDTARIVGNRNSETRRVLMQQLLAWCQGVLARGDLSDMLEDFISQTKRTPDGCILLNDVHRLMEAKGLKLTKAEKFEFDEAVDPLDRGRVIPDRLRQVWRSNESLRKTKPLSLEDALQSYDEAMAEHQGPITAMFLSSWLRRTGAPLDPDACHTLMLRLPRPLSKDIIFSDEIFQFIQDVWLEARASEREILSDAGMMERSKQLEQLAAESNDTIEDVDRASRVMSTSSHRLADINTHLQKQLEMTAKIASLIPTKYSRTLGCNTDVSVVGEMVMLWEGFLVHRDMELLDGEQDDKLTIILQKQNKAKSEEIVRLRTDFEGMVSRLRTQLAIQQQKLETSESLNVALREQLELAVVGPGGELDFEAHDAVLESRKRQSDELMKLMNHKLSSQRQEHQNKVKDLIQEISMHKARADEAERRLLSEVENIRQKELHYQQRMEELDTEIRSREDTVASSAQLVAEFELKYQKQDKHIKEVEQRLSDARQEILILKEQIEFGAHAEMIPKIEAERQIAEVQQQLTMELETERTSKLHFSQQLQSVKADLQKLEFSSLDKCGRLEAAISTVESERDAASMELASMRNRVLHVIQGIADQISNERNTVSHCPTLEALPAAVSNASGAVVDYIIALVEGMHTGGSTSSSGASSSSVVGGEDSAADRLLRKLHAERAREFGTPASDSQDSLKDVRATLEDAVTNVERQTALAKQLQERVDTQSTIFSRVVSQVLEYVQELRTCSTVEDVAELQPDAVVSIEELPSASLQDTIQQLCLGVRGCIVEMRNGEGGNDRRRSGSGLERLRTIGDLNALDETSDSVTKIHRRVEDDAASHAALSAVVCESLVRQTGALSWLTRSDMYSIATAKRAWKAATTNWLRHRWQCAIQEVRWMLRRASASRAQDADACGVIDTLVKQKRSAWLATSAVLVHEALGSAVACCTTAYGFAATKAETTSPEGPLSPSSSTAALQRRQSTDARSSNRIADAASKVIKNKLLAPSQSLPDSSSATATTSSGRTDVDRSLHSSSRSKKRQLQPSSSSSGAMEGDAQESEVQSDREEEIEDDARTIDTHQELERQGGVTVGAYENSPRLPQFTALRRASRKDSLLAAAVTLEAEDVEVDVEVEGADPAVAFSGGHSSESRHQQTKLMSSRRPEHSTRGTSRTTLAVGDVTGPVHQARSVIGSHITTSVPSNSAELENDDEYEELEGEEEVTNNGRRSFLQPAASSGEDSRVSLNAPFGRQPSSSALLRVNTVRVERSPSPFNADRQEVGVDVCPEMSDAWCSCNLVASISSLGSGPIDGGRHAVGATRTVGIQVHSLPVVAQPERPLSSSRETQTPPPPHVTEVAMGNKPAVASVATMPSIATGGSSASLVDRNSDTPTPSDSGIPVLDVHRRVDSAKRLKMPRPQSSDRPRSALRLDEESSEVLRPATPTASLTQHPSGDNATGDFGGRRQVQESSLTTQEMKRKIQAMQGWRYTDIESPMTAAAVQPPSHIVGIGGGVQISSSMMPSSAAAGLLQLDAALQYLFETLPPACRIAAGKYALLAMFSKDVQEDIFVEYLYTNHFYPNRDVFEVPTDDEMRRMYVQLRRLGHMMTKLKHPKQTTDSSGALGPAVGEVPSAARWRGEIPRATSSLAPPAPGEDGVLADVTGTHAMWTQHRPFSANSFPHAVVVLAPYSEQAPQCAGASLPPQQHQQAFPTSEDAAVHQVHHPSLVAAVAPPDAIHTLQLEGRGLMQRERPPTAPVVEVAAMQRPLSSEAQVRENQLPLDKTVESQTALKVMEKVSAQREDLKQAAQELSLLTLTVASIPIQSSFSSASSPVPPLFATGDGAGNERPLSSLRTITLTPSAAKQLPPGSAAGGGVRPGSQRHRLAPLTGSRLHSADATSTSTQDTTSRPVLLRPSTTGQDATETVHLMLQAHRAESRQKLIANGPPLVAQALLVRPRREEKGGGEMTTVIPVGSRRGQLAPMITTAAAAGSPVVHGGDEQEEQPVGVAPNAVAVTSFSSQITSPIVASVTLQRQQQQQQFRLQ